MEEEEEDGDFNVRTELDCDFHPADDRAETVVLVFCGKSGLRAHICSDCLHRMQAQVQEVVSRSQ